MDFLYKKSDGTAENLGGTVGKVSLPGMTGGDVIFVGDERPLDLGDYILVEATEVTEEITWGKKRGDTTVSIDTDNQTVTVTRTVTDSTAEECFEALRSQRNSKLSSSDWMGLSDNTMSSAWETYRQELRDLPGTLDDTSVKATITWPTEPS